MTEVMYSIGELAAAFDVTLRTIRFYEEKGLLRPQRKGNRRFYTQKQRDWLQSVLFYRQVGFSLKEIKALETTPKEEIPQKLRDQAASNSEQISNLEQANWLITRQLSRFDQRPIRAV